MGALIGLIQTVVVPLIGANEFNIESNDLIVFFIASFELVKAILNLFAIFLSLSWFPLLWYILTKLLIPIT
jgi:hypothetical protein